MVTVANIANNSYCFFLFEFEWLEGGNIRTTVDVKTNAQKGAHPSDCAFGWLYMQEVQGLTNVL